MSGRSSGGAAYMQLFKGREIQAYVGARRSLGEEEDRCSSGGAAYMQLFKGREIGEDINGKEWN